ncbi:Zinc finger CCHC domain-containing protein 3 [Holothuria leucospilota]|uniref:Zinc finger CCHC domain-containing protein 3 n=1 Tax=Holothuria leucospilota TaxID=206669 RepID=A0A9Q1CQH8_HOLLE|nr:Zinc finger CCHC domain-containing protein 3 [Holothuria leucospilota]
MELVRDIPSFLFIGGSKAHIRYFCQPRTCFRCGEEGHEAKSCPNRRCGKCLQLGHGNAECPNEVRCNICGEEGHVFGACPASYSAHVSADVGWAPEPSQTGPQYSTQELEEAALEVEQDFLASKQVEGGTTTPEADSPPSLAAAPGQVEIMTVEEDLDLSSDSAMSDGRERASEPPPKAFYIQVCVKKESGLKKCNLKLLAGRLDLNILIVYPELCHVAGILSSLHEKFDEFEINLPAQLIDELLLRVYYLYHKSPKRWRELQRLAEIVKELVIKSVRSSGTRWVSHKQAAIQALLRDYQIIINHFEDMSFIERPDIKGEDAARISGYLKKKCKPSISSFGVMHILIY